MSTTVISDVIATAAQAVAKVFVIGVVGFFAVQYPKDSPLLPPSAVSTVARFAFNVLIIPLIFSSIASSVTIDSLGDYWIMLVGALGVLSVSFTTATMLSYIIPIENKRDFIALRIAVTFPNIVSLPILIFPSLCEYPIVYEAFGTGDETGELRRDCVAKSNTMIFVYSLVWTLLFYGLGYGSLMAAAHMESPSKTENNIHDFHEGDEARSSDLTVPSTIHDNSHQGNLHQDNSHREVQADNILSGVDEAGVLGNFKAATKRVFSSPPFITTIVAFAVGCISPLRNLLFSQGGQLRFLGAATETLGQAASSILTIVVAASLVSGEEAHDNQEVREDSGNEIQALSEVNRDVENLGDTRTTRTSESQEENGSQQAKRLSMIELSKSIRRSSAKVLNNVLRTSQEQRRLYLWFTLSKLVFSPLFVVLIIAGLDCGGFLDEIPSLAKLVLVVNAAVPGALIVVVVLKSDPELYETAAVATRVYLPTYILSIATIAGWTVLGLLIALPNDDGNPFCPRR